MRAALAPLLLAAALCGGAAHAQEPKAPEQCIVCHGREAQELAGGIHATAKLSCTSCHGGNPDSLEVEEAHGPALIRLDTPRAQVESCGTCHADVQKMRMYGQRTDQLSLYWTSGHGERLAKEDDPNVATCVSCHGSHGVLGANDTRSPVHPFNQVATCGRCHADAAKMAPYGLGADAVPQYTSSVHGRALLEEAHLAAPACATCHGSHGAAPPRVAEIEQVCGQCHSAVQSHYDESPHAAAALRGALVQCASCHGHHAIARPSPEMFLGEDEGDCGSCHSAPDDPAIAIARELHADVTGLDELIRGVSEEVRKAGGHGLFLGAEKGYLDDARGLLVRARASTHQLSSPALADLLNRGQAMVMQTRESLDTKNRIFRDRRIFTAIFFGLTLLFGVVLLLYGHLIRGRAR